MTYTLAISKINIDRHNRFSDHLEESYSDTIGSIYRDCVREYGRCTSKVYQDTPNGKAKAIGWVFLKRMEYSDFRSTDTYLQETWITVLTKVSEPVSAKYESVAI